jgi:hypothetical protein
MVNPLINLYRTKEQALSFKDSPVNRYYKFSGVHLLPNNPIPYIQVTNTPNGINLEDWTVYGVDVYSGQKTTITGSFMVLELTNSLNGNPQFIWSLTNVPVDFGYGLIYLEIQQAIGETFYSTPFLLTDFNKELTTLFNYKYKRTDRYQSIGMQCWFKEPNQMITLTNYYQKSTESTVTSAITKNTTEIYSTEVMSKNQLIRLVDIVSLPYVYLEGVRSCLYSAPEIPKKIGEENFGKLDFEVTLDENDIFVADDYTEDVMILPSAVNDTFNALKTGVQTLLVLRNDSLGTVPTNITYITSSGFNVGSIAISNDGQSILFTPNGLVADNNTFNYTITDSNGNTSTATVILNVKSSAPPLVAVSDSYELSSIGVQNLYVLSNDSLGTVPTNITSINQSGITTGIISIVSGGQSLIFTPNGNIANGQTFTYTIQDSTLTTSTATVYITVYARPVSFDGGIYNQSFPNSGTGCSFNVNTMCFYETEILSNGSQIFTNDLLTDWFVGDGQYYHFVDYEGIHKKGRVDSIGIITQLNNC